MADRRRNRRIAALLVTVPLAMGALAWASAPLYRLFCQVTGFGGTPGTAAEAPQAAADAPSIEVRFNADIAPDLDWRFGPVERRSRSGSASRRSPSTGRRTWATSRSPARRSSM